MSKNLMLRWSLTEAKKDSHCLHSYYYFPRDPFFRVFFPSVCLSGYGSKWKQGEPSERNVSNSVADSRSDIDDDKNFVSVQCIIDLHVAVCYSLNFCSLFQRQREIC